MLIMALDMESSSYQMLLPASMLLGGLLLLLADTAGRSLAQPIEIPVGIVISILAAPYFLYLLRKQAWGGEC
jgi:iron complex transport system permease protein